MYSLRWKIAATVLSKLFIKWLHLRCVSPLKIVQRQIHVQISRKLKCVCIFKGNVSCIYQSRKPVWYLLSVSKYRRGNWEARLLFQFGPNMFRRNYLCLINIPFWLNLLSVNYIASNPTYNVSWMMPKNNMRMVSYRGFNWPIRLS